jgi:hypothetical protein
MKFEKFPIMLISQQSVDQAGKWTGQYNDLEHILYMYTYFEFDAVKTGMFGTHFNFSNLIFSRWYVWGLCYIAQSVDDFILLYRRGQ